MAQPVTHPPGYHSQQHSAQPLVELKSIWKVFTGVPVLKGIDLNLMPGEIHALLGGNGSGKSTTMKILSGVYTPERGQISLNGESKIFHRPRDAHKSGIYMVPQEPHMFPHLSVEENLLLGLDIEPDEARTKIMRLAQEIGFESSLSELAGALSIANQQLLEIIRGLLRKAQVLILDEPTSALTFREVENLFKRMQTLSQRGIGIFFISHRLNEVLTISHRISVLREGHIVLVAPTSEVNSEMLVQAMLPEDADVQEVEKRVRSSQNHLAGEVVLEAKHLSSDAFHDVSFSVRAGEVVGLAGLVGAGRTEVAEAVVGLDPNARGEVIIKGQRMKKHGARKSQALGLVYVPEDRHAHSIFLDLPSLYTMTATILGQLGRYLLSSKQDEAVGDRYRQQLSIKMNSLYQIAKTLSGGNQQKVVLSKALASKPDIIILDEPTRGVDASARLDVYQLIENLAKEGVGILLISSELEEIVDLSDRILVMYQGRIINETVRADVSLQQVMSAAFGLQGEVSL
jgi:AI-2 transport system ATP-binding protein